MSIEVHCLQCGASHQVNLNMAGRRVRCPECDTVVHVPEADPLSQQPSSDLVAPDEPQPAAPAGPSVPVTPVALVTPDPTETHDPTVDPIAQPGDSIESSQVDDQPLTASPVMHHHPLSTEKVSEVEMPDTHIVILDGEEDDDPVFVPSKRPNEEVDMTPMVDVTFLLLIFFMVTAAFHLQKSIQVPRQQTDQPSSNIEEEIDELDLVEIQIDEFGSFLVMAPEWERETPGKQNLVAALREAIAGDRDGMRLTIKVHELAKLHALVDAMDAGTIAGYSELQVTQVEEFD